MTIEVKVVEGGIIVKWEEAIYVYKDMADFFSHYHLVIGRHFNLTIEEIPLEIEKGDER